MSGASSSFPDLPEGWTEHTQQLGALFYREYRRPRPLHGRALFIVHGFGEQSDRFRHFPHYLYTTLDTIGLIDLPGHGQSAGQRGYIASFDEYSSAVLAGFHFLRERCPKQTQLHWLGLSCGGLITLRTMVREKNLPLSSVAVAEAMLGIAVKVPWIKEKMGRLIAPIFGRLPMDNGIAAEDLSHDHSVQTTYIENPLNHSRITPRTFVEMENEMAAMMQFQGAFPYPLQMLVSTSDHIVDWKKEILFAKGLTSRLQLQTFPGYRHEIFNDLGKERAFIALENWLGLNSI